MMTHLTILLISAIEDFVRNIEYSFYFFDQPKGALVLFKEYFLFLLPLSFFDLLSSSI